MSTLSAPLHRDALATGTVLNGYQIIGVLGRGGFGITYRASDLLDQSFAIKEFFPRQFAMRADREVVVTSESDQAVFVDCRKRFLTEARLLASLGRDGGTPGIVRVVTFFEANNTAYSVMELLVGETLDDRLRAKDFPSPQLLLGLLRGILTPLAQVHAAGFLHRDIKPSNILLRAGGQPVLIDFGSARDMRPTASSTTYTQVYSGNYAPIEQMLHGAPQGPYSDIYSVGGVAYRAIGGSLVDARARQQAILSRAPDPLTPAAEVGLGRYPESLLHAIDQALAVAAKDRPQRVEEMLALLDRTFDGEATVRHTQPIDVRARLSSSSRGPNRRSGTWWGRIAPAAINRLSRSVGLLRARKRPAAQSALASLKAGTLSPRRRKSPVIFAAIAAAIVIAAGAFAYLWLPSEDQRLDPLAAQLVRIDRNGSEISAKFPETTDTAKLIAALPYLIKLKVTALDLSNSQIVTLPSLQGLSSLERLDLRGSQVTMLESLRGLTALRELDLSKTKVAAVPSLQDLAALQRLDLSYTALMALPSLEDLTSLRQLNLSHTNVAWIPPLERLTALQYLDLTDTNVTSVPDIQELPNLRVMPERLRLPPEPAATPREQPPPAANASVVPSTPVLAPPPQGSTEPLPPQLPPLPPPRNAIRPQVALLPTPPAPPPRIQEAPKPKPPPLSEPPLLSGRTPPPQAMNPAPPNSETPSPPSDGQDYFLQAYEAYQAQNYAQARSLYQRCAERGNAKCAYNLGNMYQQGLGGGADYGQARLWYEKAANHGYGYGLYSMGLLYFEGGPGLAKDCAIAHQWFEQEAARKIRDAQAMLGRSCY
jgi:serine/threonine protein kinase